MTYSTRPPINLRFTSPPDEVDGLLRRFYRAQLPVPWPAPPQVPVEQPTPQPQRLAVSRFFRLDRLAVAAAVVLLVIGYLALQGWFPDPKPNKPANSLTPGGEIGRKLKIIERQPTNNPDARLIIVEDLGARK
jgi:hypothetical protein